MIDKVLNKLIGLTNNQIGGFTASFMLIMLAVYAMGMVLYFFKRRYKTSIAAVLFLLYVYIIYRITVFSRVPMYNESNLLPLYNFITYIKYGRFNFTELIGNFLNITLFMPLGFSLGMFNFRKNRIKITVLVSVLISISIEVIQYITGRGQAMTDDVICNVMGGVLGCLIFIFFSKIFIKATEEEK